MKRFLLAAVALASASTARADSWEDQIAAMLAGQNRLREACGLGKLVTHLDHPTIAVDAVDTFTVTGWTGGCTDGKRDGEGTLSTETRHKHEGPNSDKIYDSVETTVTNGTYVRGVQMGLWCTTQDTTVATTETRQGMIGCRLYNPPEFSALYRKEADGRWRDWGNGASPFDPATYIAAGTLEAESARLVADARAGRKSAPIELTSTSEGLNDLVSGGRLTMALDNVPIDFAHKRVAMVLSTNTIKEIDRFRAIRQRLIDATVAMPDPSGYRATFIANSDPAKMLKQIAIALREKTGGAVAGDDLGVLAAGKADYVLLLDWRFTGAIDLTEAQYEAMPACAAYDDPKCSSYFQSKLSFMVVNRDLKVVRLYDLGRQEARRIHFAGFIPKTGYADLTYSLGITFQDWGDELQLTKGVLETLLDFYSKPLPTVWKPPTPSE